MASITWYDGGVKWPRRWWHTPGPGQQIGAVDVNESSAPPAHRTTRHIRCDEDFLELLEEDFGIDAYSLVKAFMGVPPAAKKEAIALCEWAILSAGGDPERA